MNGIAAYRVTSEDLEGGDHKTITTLQPLLESLNYTLPAVINTVNGLSTPEVRKMSLQTGAVVADSFPFKFSTSVQTPLFVLMANCVPQDTAHPLDVPFVMQGYTAAGGQVQTPFITGLLPNNRYNLTFVVT